MMTLAERLRALIERLEDIGPSEVRWTNAEQFEDVTHGLKALADEVEGKVLVNSHIGRLTVPERYFADTISVPRMTGFGNTEVEALADLQRRIDDANLS